jgi:3D (Asp-Asp-Asp) domain-containing protein
MNFFKSPLFYVFVICLIFHLGFAAILNGTLKEKYEEFNKELLVENETLREEKLELELELIRLQGENNFLTLENQNLKAKFSFKVKASAYTPSIDECNDDIENTAIMVKPKPGYHIAVSPDLKWLLGKKVYIPGYGVRKVADLMNKRFEKKIDLMVASKEAAYKFGVKEVELVVLN